MGKLEKELEVARARVRVLEDKIEKRGGEWPRRITMWVNGCKEHAREMGEEIGLEGEAQHDFSYALYEVEFVLSVNEDGSYEIISCDGKKLVTDA
jgi:hypothetical protein